MPDKIKGCALQVRSVSHYQSAAEQFSKLITAKIEDGNVHAALRVLLSDDTLAEVNDVTFANLQEARNSHTAENRRNVPDPLSIDAYLQVSESKIKAAISSFPTGSSSGTDGLLPQLFRSAELLRS